MSEILTNILNFLLWFTSLPAQVPGELWALIASALGVSVVTQSLKHWIDEKVDPRFMVTLTTIFSGLAACLLFLINGLTQNPTVLGTDTATILAISTLLYRFLVAPGYSFLQDVQDYRAQKKDSKLSEAIENEIKEIDASKVLPQTPAQPTVNPLIADEFQG